MNSLNGCLKPVIFSLSKGTSESLVPQRGCLSNMSNPGGGDSLGKKKTTWFQLSSPRGHGGHLIQVWKQRANWATRAKRWAMVVSGLTQTAEWWLCSQKATFQVARSSRKRWVRMTPEEKRKPETSRKLELSDSNGDVKTYLEQIHNMAALLFGHLAGDLTVDWEMFTDKKKSWVAPDKIWPH